MPLGWADINLYIYFYVYLEHKTLEVCNTDNFKTSCSKEQCLEEREHVKRYYSCTGERDNHSPQLQDTKGARIEYKLCLQNK